MYLFTGSLVLTYIKIYAIHTLAKAKAIKLYCP